LGLVADCLTELQVGQTLECDLSTASGDDGVTFALADAPEGMSLDPTSGKLTWTPRADQVGPVQLSIVTMRGSANAVGAMDLSVVANAVPVIEELTCELLIEAGLVWECSVRATDADGGEVRLGLAFEPSGMVLEDGTLRWTPTTDQAGYNLFQVTASDGVHTTTRQVSVRVSTPDRPVVLLFDECALSVDEDTEYRCGFRLAEPLAEAHRFELRDGPAGMVLDAEKLEVRYTVPNVLEVVRREYTIAVVRDGAELRDGNGFFAMPVNDAPTIKLVDCPRTVQEDETFACGYEIADEDEDRLFVSLNEGPSGMQVDTVERRLSWVAPETATASQEKIVLTVSDGKASASATHEVRVLPVNDAPQLAFLECPRAEAEDEEFVCRFEVFDLDGDDVEVTLVSGPNGLTLAGDEIRWRVPPVLERHDERFVLAVADGTVTLEVPRTVLVYPANDPPTLLFGDCPATVLEDELYRCEFDLLDEDGDRLEVTLASGAPTGMRVEGKAVVWTVPETAVPTAVSYQLEVRDAEGSDRFGQSVLALPVNDPPRLVFGSCAARANEGQSYVCPFTVSDPEGDTLEVSVAAGPELLIVVGNEVRWMVGETLVETPVAYQLRVSDGRASMLEANSLIAVPVNDPPSLTIGPCGPALVGQLFTCPLAVVDPDSTAFTFTARAPAGATVNQQTRTVSWLPAFADLGLVTFRVSVSDGTAEDSETASVTVRNQDTGGTCDECQYVPPPGVFSPVVEWEASTFTVDPSAKHVSGMPVVANVNDDDGDGRITVEGDIPDIVFVTYPEPLDFTNSLGRLRVYSGDGSGELFTVTSHYLDFDVAPAVGDIDGDGFVEIIVGADGGTGGLLAFEHDGTLKWSAPGISTGTGAAAIADLDQDGQPEVLFRDRVLRNNGQQWWQAGGGDTTDLPIAFDHDLDGDLEVLIGRGLYNKDGTLVWRASSLLSGDVTSAVGNFDIDPNPEIALIHSNNTSKTGFLSLLDHDGTLKWSRSLIRGCTCNNNCWRAGSPNVADFDGDGVVDVATAGACSYFVYKAEGTLLWEVPTEDDSSAITSSSVFDFDGDGNAEAVYADEHHLRIYDGASGTVLYALPNSTRTRREYAVIADVDNDGNAEVVVASNDHVWGTTHGIKILGDERDNWVPTRRIWNQHSYHVTNVQENGAIPRVEPSNLELYNNFRQNVQGEFSEDVFDAPDLRPVLSWVDRGGCPSRIVYEVLLLNEGEMQLGAGVQLGVYGVDGAGERFLVSALSEEGIPSCSQTLLRIELASSALTGLQEIVLHADDPSRHNECNENNNLMRFEVLRCP